MLGSDGEGMVEVGAQPRGREEETLCRPEKTDVGCVVGSEPDVTGQGGWPSHGGWRKNPRSWVDHLPFPENVKNKKREFPEVIR